MGVFWPCPSLDHPGTPRLFEGGVSFHPGRQVRVSWRREWRESGDPVDADFPIYLTTGRVVSQYLSGTQTRRIGALVDQYPEPRVEIHPRLAEQHRHRRRRLGDGHDAAGGDHAAGDGGAAPSGRTPCSFRTTGPADRARTG